jgi:tRNA (guanine-N7-)-methyltransferase
MRSRAGKVRVRASPEQLLSAGMLLAKPAAPAKLDLPTIYGNHLPIELEIGPGKGGFLLARATARPEINLLGVEWALPYALYAADRARRAGLTNVRLICADARDLFATTFARRCISRVHLYFPDPWPKRRHRDRRLITAPFLGYLRHALRIGGWLGIITDHGEYFGQIRSVLSAAAGLVQVPFRPPLAADNWLVGSNFEKKYAADGRPFHAIAAIRYL